MKFLAIIKLECLVLTIFFFTNVYSQNSIKFSTEGQQYGVADLDHFWISATKDKNSYCFEKRIEHPNEFTVGHEAGKSNTKDGFVWDQFGCEPNDPYHAKSGWIRYNNISCQGKCYLKIRYSKHSPSNTKIEIYVNEEKQAEFIPIDQGNWESFAETNWIELNFPYSCFVNEISELHNQNTCILYDNYPNPFNTATNIYFYLALSSKIKLSIFNINGKLIKNIIDSNYQRGEHHVVWDGTNYYGEYMASGFYIYRLSVDNNIRHKKLLFVK